MQVVLVCDHLDQRSTVITIARITPAIGTMMELDRFSIQSMQNTAIPSLWGLSYLYGYPATFWFTLSNIPERLLIIPPTSISFQSVSSGLQEEIHTVSTSFSAAPRRTAAARIS